MELFSEETKQLLWVHKSHSYTRCIDLFACKYEMNTYLHAFATRRRRQRNRNCQETNKTEKKMQIFEVNCVECVDVCVGMEWDRKVESKYTLSSNVETLLRRSFVRLWVRCCLSSKLTIQNLEIGDFNNIQRLHCVNLHIRGMRNDNFPPSTTATATAINHPNNRNSIVESNLSMFRSAANRMRSKAIGDTWARRKYNIMSCINAIVRGVGAGRACVFLMVMFLLWTHKHINIACPCMSRLSSVRACVRLLIHKIIRTIVRKKKISDFFRFFLVLCVLFLVSLCAVVVLYRFTFCSNQLILIARLPRFLNTLNDSGIINWRQRREKTRMQSCLNV